MPNPYSLKSGSCLSPLTHPSYDYGKQGKLIKAKAEYEKRLAILKDEYPEFAGAL
jgi:hypothetical protein